MPLHHASSSNASLRVALLCIGVLCVAGAAPARADVTVSAWMLLLHEADSAEAARAWAKEHCDTLALAPHCGDELNEGALGAHVGVYATADWPGLDSAEWFVGLGPVRSRRRIRAVQTALQDAGLTAPLYHLPALPRVSEWAAGALGEWRLWTLREPATQREVLYLSRTGQADLEIGRGWPLPREDGSPELYAIGPAPDAETVFYIFHSGAPHALDVQSGEVAPAPAASPEEIAGVLAAAARHFGSDAEVRVLWALPSTAAAAQDIPTSGGGTRRHVLRLARTEDAWEVVGEEMQTPHVPRPEPAPAAERPVE